MKILILCITLMFFSASNAPAGIKKEVNFLTKRFDERREYITTFKNGGCDLKWSYSPQDGYLFPLAKLNVKLRMNGDIPTMDLICNNGEKCIFDLYSKTYSDSKGFSFWDSDLEKAVLVKKSITKLIKFCGGNVTATSNSADLKSQADSYRESNLYKNSPRRGGWEITSTFFSGNTKIYNIKCNDGNTASQIYFYPDSGHYGSKGSLVDTLQKAANKICN